MVSEVRFWVQFLSATQFFAMRIPLSLAFAEPIGTAVPEREQAIPIAVAHMQQGEYWTSIRSALTASISHVFYY
jgi:hypothetical protein